MNPIDVLANPEPPAGAPKSVVPPMVPDGQVPSAQSADEICPPIDAFWNVYAVVGKAVSKAPLFCPATAFVQFIEPPPTHCTSHAPVGPHEVPALTTTVGPAFVHVPEVVLVDDAVIWLL